MTTQEPTTAPRTPLSRERVVSAAVELADRDGLESLSMRRLADVLGAGAMSLYHYVPNKDELITGMVDVVFGEIELPPIGGDWKSAMRQRARSTREVLNRHRWAVELMESRAMPGPASVRVHDTVLGYLREGGFSIEMTIQAYSVLDAYIYGFALTEKSVPFEDPEGAAAVAQEQAQAFETMAAEFPYLAEVVAGHVAEVGHDFGPTFEYGLDLVLDALEARRSASAPRT
jgi:AcrR family transcriptional regulator